MARLQIYNKPAFKKSNYSNSQSRYKGVSPFYGKWRVKFTVNGKQMSFGLYDSEEQASQIYNLVTDTFSGEKVYNNIRAERTTISLYQLRALLRNMERYSGNKTTYGKFLRKLNKTVSVEF